MSDSQVSNDINSGRCWKIFNFSSKLLL